MPVFVTGRSVPTTRSGSFASWTRDTTGIRSQNDDNYPIGWRLPEIHRGNVYLGWSTCSGTIGVGRPDTDTRAI